MQNYDNDGGKTNVIIALIVLLLIITGFVAYKKGIFTGPASSVKEPPVVRENRNDNAASSPNQSESNDNEEVDYADDAISDLADEGKRSPEKADESLRQRVIDFVMDNLNKLVPPPKDDKWDIPLFYFVGNSNIYLELYGYDTELTGLKLLYKVEKDGEKFKLTELARYKEGKEDWTLVSGTDSFSDYIIEEYGFDEETNKWEKTDEFVDESSFE
ncbi:MAG: hypothetical protein FJZ04_00435 [Candidatus Moranbacteria bacterium]|nr:hypothetical protein [Candidatus Moranbacteria bacterium]